MSNEIPEINMETVRNAVEILREHFDTVQIFCSRLEEDGNNTAFCCHGAGNWFARYGQIREWMNGIEKQTDLSKQIGVGYGRN